MKLAIVDSRTFDDITDVVSGGAKGADKLLGEYSASDIKYLIQQYISKDFSPKIVVIDHFECLKPEKKY